MVENNDNKIDYPSIDSLPEGMLSSPQIKFCISEGFLVTHEHEDIETLLKNVSSAVYKMRLGISVWGHDKKGKEFTKDFDQNKKIILEPNSLTFVTVWEKFNLPRNIIARFNLKSRLVHKGLLLGTGPIVDPQFVGRIFIPLHNFSNTSIELKPGETFINVEFTKTLSVETINNKYTYVENPSKEFIPKDYAKELGDIPSSSIQQTVKDYNKMISRTSNIQMLTIGALIVSTISLGYAAFSMHASIRESIENSTLREKQYLEFLNQPSQELHMQLRRDYHELSKKYLELEKELNRFKLIPYKCLEEVVNKFEDIKTKPTAKEPEMPEKLPSQKN